MFRGNTGYFSNIPPITKNLLIINALCWLASLTLPSISHKIVGHSVDLIDLLGMHFILSDKFNAVQLVTYMFLHDTGGFTHLLFNMFSVFMFGRILESHWGAKRFITFYMLTGIGAAIVQQVMWAIDFYPIITMSQSAIEASGLNFTKEMIYGRAITIGASGAVFGILLGFGMLFPNVPLYIMFIPIPVKAKYVMIGYGLIELFMGVANFTGDNVAHFAHLGGMLFAFFIIRAWKKKDYHQHGNYY